MDVDGSGRIEFDEFLTMMTKHKKSLQTEMDETWAWLCKGKKAGSHIWPTLHGHLPLHSPQLTGTP